MQVYTPLKVGDHGWSSVPFEEELSAAAIARVRPLLAILAIVYLEVSAISVFGRTGGAQMICSWTAYVAGVICFVSWMMFRRRRVAATWIHGIAALISAAVLLHGFVSLRVSVGYASEAVVFFVMAANAATLFSVTWQWLIAGVSFGSWFLTHWPVRSSNDLWYGSLVLLFTAALSGLSVYYRVWKHKKQRKEKGLAGGRDAMFPREFLACAVDGSEDGLWYWDLTSNVFHFSPVWESLLGYAPGELSKSPDEWLDRVHPGYVARLREELAAHLRGDEPQFRNEHRIRRRDGTYLWVLARAKALRNDAGEPVVLAGSHSDITPMIAAEKRLLTDVFEDKLTGLPNRSFLMSHLDLAVAEKRSRGRAAPLFAVMFLDLDRFKSINDTMGHQVGDELLAAVAERLKNATRPGDVVSRFGGDEFVVLLRNLHGSEDAMQVGERVRMALSAPFRLGGREVRSGGSIGIALSSEEFSQSDEILSFGDLAMYRAKKLRDGQAQLFHPAMREETGSQAGLQGELARALERRELLLHYQPSIHMASGKIVGAEALIRWRRSSGDILYPGEFLPMAEESGLIHDIGEWALRTACAQNSAWQRAGVSPVRMAVNLSARQLEQRDLPGMVKSVLEEARLHPEWLELEVTENSLMRNADLSARTLQSLAGAGIRTAIDNFGTGHSSLNNLRQFEFHTLKMDRCFVSGVTTDMRTAAVARGLIALAHDLGLAVVAEGVEKKDQFRFLSEERCDHVQGFLTGRPVPSEAMFAMLRSGQSPMLQPPEPTGFPGVPAIGGQAGVPGADALRWASERQARR